MSRNAFLVFVLFSPFSRSRSSLRERPTFFFLQHEDAGVHADSSPLYRLTDLTFAGLDLLTIPAEIDKVEGVVKDCLVLDGIFNLIFGYLNISLILIRWIVRIFTNLTLNLLVNIRFLLSVVYVVDSDFIILFPKLCHAHLNDFQSVFELVHSIDKYIAGCRFFVCKNR